MNIVTKMTFIPSQIFWTIHDLHSISSLDPKPSITHLAPRAVLLLTTSVTHLRHRSHKVPAWLLCCWSHRVPCFIPHLHHSPLLPSWLSPSLLLPHCSWCLIWGFSFCCYFCFFPLCFLMIFLLVLLICSLPNQQHSGCALWPCLVGPDLFSSPLDKG